MTHRYPSISLHNVNVDFPFHTDASKGLKDISDDLTDAGEVESLAGAIFIKRDKKVVANALSNIQITIKNGEKVGLLGHNGAGKSTLIRVMTGLLEPTSGRVNIVGKISTLASTTSGFDMALTGRENIMRRFLLMRVPKGDIPAMEQDTIKFAELGRYINMPMRTYSSGMKARLGFAITTSVNADILVMDEWIGAGDPRFLERCEERLEQLIGQTRILVLASHKERLLRRVCNRFFVLDKGRAYQHDFNETETLPRLEENPMDAMKRRHKAQKQKLKTKIDHYRQQSRDRKARIISLKEEIARLKEAN